MFLRFKNIFLNKKRIFMFFFNFSNSFLMNNEQIQLRETRFLMFE